MFQDRNIKIVKFFRHPLSRIYSEYSYVRSHSGHNLHNIAVNAQNFERYLTCPDRPRNRQCKSVLGNYSDCSDLAIDIARDFFFVGFVETFAESVGELSKNLRIKYQSTHLNSSKNDGVGSILQDKKLLNIVTIEDEADCILYDTMRSLRGK